MNSYMNEYLVRTTVAPRLEQARTQRHLAEYLRTTQRRPRSPWRRAAAR